MEDNASVDPVERCREPVTERLSGDVDRVEMENRSKLAQQGPHASGGVEILHVAVADGLEVHQHRRLVRDGIEAGVGHPDAAPARDGGEVDHRIGGAADRHQHPERVLDRALGEDLAR